MANITELDLSYHKTIWEFMQDDSFVRMVVGPVGSGKSTGVICGEVMRRAMMQAPSPKDNIRYFKALIVRNTMPDLKKTTIKTWQGMYPETLGEWKNNPPQHHIKVPATKSIPGLDLLVEFVGLDTAKDAAKLLSWEGTLIAFNEAKEIQKDIVDQATARVGRYPSMKQGGVMPSWYGVIMDTNPYNSGHWLDKLEKDVPDTWKFFRQPPGVLEMEKVDGGWKSMEARFPLTITEDQPEYIHAGGGSLWAVNPKAENLPYLPVNHVMDPEFKPNTQMETDPVYLNLARRRSGGYYANIVKGKERSYIQIYVQGKNGALNSDHAVIPEFDRATMVTPSAEYNETMPLHMGIDFGAGTLNPAAVIGQLDPIEGRWMVLAEVICENMGLIDFVEQVKLTLKEKFYGFEELKIWGDPAGLQRDGVSMKTYFDHLRTHGLYAQPAPTNQIDVRIECIKSPMKRFTRGKPGILFSPKCEVLIAALEEKWCYRRLNVSGEVRYDDKPCKDHPHSDAADALGYMLAGGGEHGALTRISNTQLKQFDLDCSWDAI